MSSRIQLVSESSLQNKSSPFQLKFNPIFICCLSTRTSYCQFLDRKTSMLVNLTSFFQHCIFDFEANLKGNPIFDSLYLGQYSGRYICKLMSSDNTVKNNRNITKIYNNSYKYEQNFLDTRQFSNLLKNKISMYPKILVHFILYIPSIYINIDRTCMTKM